MQQSTELLRAFPSWLLVASGLYLALGVFAVARSRSQLVVRFVLVMTLAAGWAFTYYRELAAVGFDDKLWWYQIKYLFVLSVPVAWLALTSHFVGGVRWLGPRVWAALVAIPVLTVPLVMTLPGHEVFRYHFHLEAVHGVDVLFERWGPWGWLQAFDGYLKSFLSLGILGSAWMKRTGVARRQMQLVFLAYAIPLAFNIVFNLGLSPLRGVNLSMFSLLLTSWVWLWAFFGYGMLNLIPIAREVLLENLSSVVLVVDVSGSLAEANKAAAQKLGLALPRVIGERAVDVVPEAWKPLVRVDAATEDRVRADEPEGVTYFERSVTPLADTRKQQVGWLLLFRDVTERVKQEQAALEMERLREERKFARQMELLVRDLHDGIGGITANIGMMAAMGMRGDAVEMKELLRRISDLATEGSSEVRSLMNALDSREIQWADLIFELRRYGRTILEQHGLAFSLNVVGDPPAEGPALLGGMSLLRSVRESLNNVAKHAEAKSATVTMTFSASRVVIEVADDGKGLPAESRRGRGLGNMKQRAKELGGEVELVSNAGLTVRLTLPIPLLSPGRVMDDTPAGAPT